MSPLIWTIAAVFCLIALRVLRHRCGWIGGLLLATLLTLAGGFLAEYSLRRYRSVDVAALSPGELAKYIPAQEPTAGYVTSNTCRECHPAQHASWFSSYHRTITQLPSDSAIQPEFSGELTLPGELVRLQKGNGQFRAEFPDPDDPEPGPHSRIERPVALVTGSHHLQLYWYPSGIPRVLGQLPAFYHLGERQWIPASSSVLAPHPSNPESATGQWNSNCLRCHATIGRPRPVKNGEQTELDTLFAELGVSCEACHGPGERHVEFRKQSRDAAAGIDNDPIVNPARLDHRRASQVCGFCHSFNTQLTPDLRRKENQDGPLFRPGDDMSQTLRLIRLDAENHRELKLADGKPDEFFPARFWTDGMVRTGGHEFNGLSESVCYQKGTMSCQSCHDMHQNASDTREPREWAAGQLSADGLSDAACVRCHAPDRYETPVHTHHRAESSGARCVNCHMPHTAYGLLRAQRSHQISSPRLAVQMATSRPNACNLCHLDQPLGWTATHLSEWYQQQPPPLDPNQKEIAEGIRLALTGDASLRALAAWHMAWEPARAVSGDDWMAPVLTQLLLDPYDAVRFIAGRTVKSLPGLEDVQYDSTAPPSQFSDEAKRVLKIWSLQRRSPSGGRSRVLLDDRGRFLDTEMSRLLRLRDRKNVELVE